MRTLKARWVLPALMICLWSQVQGAEVEKQLEGIKKKIARERQGISKVQKKEGSVLKDLRKVEEALDKKDRELKQINGRLEAVVGDLQRKEEEAQKTTSSLQTRRELLRTRVKALYKWQRGGSPFVLLNGGFSVAELMQRKRYLEITLAYDQQLVAALGRESIQLEALKEELVKKREEVDRERGRLVEVKEAIRLQREKKKLVLASLRREKEVRVRALEELEQAAHRLQKMMDEISRKAMAKTGEVPGQVNFETMRGKLEYPVRGEVTDRKSVV